MICRTLVILKPDAISRHLVGRIIQRLEDKGFYPLRMVLRRVTQAEAETLYMMHRGKSFYPNLLRFTCSGPVILSVWEGNNVVRLTRLLVGSTNPFSAVPGSIRGMYAHHLTRNVIHASDTLDNAEREISIFFPDVALMPKKGDGDEEE